MSVEGAQQTVKAWEGSKPGWLQQWLQPPDATTTPFCMVSSSSSSSSSGSSGSSGSSQEEVSIILMQPVKDLPDDVGELLLSLQTAVGDLVQLGAEPKLVQLQQQLRAVFGEEGGSAAAVAAADDGDDGDGSISSSSNAVDAFAASLLPVLVRVQQQDKLSEDELQAVAPAIKAVAALLQGSPGGFDFLLWQSGVSTPSPALACCRCASVL
jgi:hypothetical protein